VTSAVCFVSQRTYPVDPRLTTETQALQKAGYEVDLICMRGPGEPSVCVLDGLNVYRIPSLARKRGGQLRYMAEYISFLVLSVFVVAWLHLRKRYKVVHVTNLPDFLMMAALIPRLLGAKTIFDVRECTPEMYGDRFQATAHGGAIKLMGRIEQFSVRLAHAVVTCTEQQRQALISRGTKPDKVLVVLNVSSADFMSHPQLPDRANEPDGSFRIVTHGTIIKRYGHEILIRAMPHVIEKIPHAHLEILGRGKLQPELERLVESLGLTRVVTFGGFVPDDELIRRLRIAHCGVVPLFRTAESDLIHTFKMFDYVALGIPVVISYTTAVAAYFDESCVSFFTAGNERELAQAIVDLYEHPEQRYEQAKNALKTFEQYAPATQQAAYRNVVQNLLKHSGPRQHMDPVTQKLIGS